jgi:hypothetical protein
VWPTLRETGATRCEHDRRSLEWVPGPWVGLTKLEARGRWRCRWCGATWSEKAGKWCGGTLDWPQDVCCVPLPGG